MFRKSATLAIIGMFISCLFFSESTFSGYVEGLDTTDVNGYSSDSTFVFGVGEATARQCVYYYSDLLGLFHYSFDDIKMAYQGNYKNNGFPLSACFVILRKDSTYSKFQITRKLASGQYEYRYGTNFTPNDRMLEKADYDRSIRYKPNNVRLTYFPYHAWDTLLWDPPLPNNNHLLGYEIYRTKIGINIDTAAPINLDQWDSVAYVDSSKRSASFDPGYQYYLNFVAVYSEGKSDFLQGWTPWVPPVGVKPVSPSTQKIRNGIELEKTFNGYSINLNSLAPYANSLSVAIYDLNGHKVSVSTGYEKKRVLLNTAASKIMDGFYLVEAKLSNETVLRQKVLISR